MSTWRRSFVNLSIAGNGLPLAAWAILAFWFISFLTSGETGVQWHVFGGVIGGINGVKKENPLSAKIDIS